MKAEIIIDNENGVVQLFCILKVPNVETSFSQWWTIHPITEDKFSLYKETASLISESFKQIIKDMEYYQKGRMEEL